MIRLIAAVDRNRGIAKGGLQPWKITADEQYFRDMTLQHGGNVLMGSKTFEVIGHALPGRRNFVVSREQVSDATVETATDLIQFLNTFHEDLWVIGGATIFEQTIGRAGEVYLTHIDADFGCDQFFPEFEHAFRTKDKSTLHEENGFIFTYATYLPLN